MSLTTSECGPGAADWRREESTRHLVVYKKAWVENRCIKNCKIAQVRRTTNREDATSRKWCEATYSERTGWSLTSPLRKCIPKLTLWATTPSAPLR